MNTQRSIFEIGKSLRLRIVNRLKRAQGLSVNELAEAFSMSYMGIKQHCLDLEKRGYLETWRRPKAPSQVGRPEIIYRLTQKSHDLFPEVGNELTLELLQATETLYGPAAPEKLLFLAYQRRAEQYLAKIEQTNASTLAERAAWLAKAREAEGYMAELECEPRESDGGLRIVEYHSPIAGLLKAYPALLNRLEQELFSRVLKTAVKREQTPGALYSCVFRLG